MPRLFRITTVPMSLKLLLKGQPRYMQENGFEVIMLSAEGPEKNEVLATEECLHIVVPFTRAITPLKDIYCLWKLVLLFRRERPDIVHTHTPKAGLLGMLAARLTGIPIRIHTIAGLPFMTAKGRKRKLLIAMEKLTFWGAQHVWPNSKSMLAFVKAQQLCPVHKLGIISQGSTNGIDLQEFSNDYLDAGILLQVKKSFNYVSNLRYIMAIGRVVKDKGIPELVEAFIKLYARHKDLRLILIGPLEEERKEELLPVHTLEYFQNHPAIQHISWTDRVAYYLSLAAVLVHASHREGFPNVPLQAGAMGCPIVCSAIPGNIDIVIDETVGTRFEVGQVDQLVNSLDIVLSNPDLAKEKAKRLQKNVYQYFDRKVVHQALFDKYQDLMGAKIQDSV